MESAANPVVQNLVVQGGALGVLAVFMLLVAVYVRDRARKEDARMDKSMSFLQEVATRSIQAQESHLQAWRELTGQTLAALNEISTELRGHAQDSKEAERRVLDEMRGLRGGRLRRSSKE